MSESYEKTMQLLAKSKNRAAQRLVESALRSSHDGVRRLASREVITSPNPRSLVELIRQFDKLEPETLEMLAQHTEKLVGPIRSAILSSDEKLHRNGYRAILFLNVVEVLPDLLSILSERQNRIPASSPLPDTILATTKFLIEMLVSRQRRQYLSTVILPEIVRILAEALKQFRRNDSPVLLQVFLELYPFICDRHEFFKEVFFTRAHPASLAISRLLLQTPERFAADFVWFVLNEPEIPPIALQMIAKRDDIPFLQHLFEPMQDELPEQVEEYFSQIEHLDWLGHIRTILDQLEGPYQPGLVQLLAHMRLTDGIRISLFNLVLQHGKPQGRQKVFDCLAAMHGERVEEMILQACEDRDPDIQAAALTQIKTRNMPQATLQLLHHVDSPHEVVRKTVQGLLSEFRIHRLLGSFDQFTDEQRRYMAKLIRKLDPQFVPILKETLLSGTPIQKAKGILCIEYAKAVPLLEDVLCSTLLFEENATLRRQAARLLAEGRRDISRNTLVQAFHRDPVADVRNAAKTSLENRPAPWAKE